jgi:tetraacyldisaccharide 4'-kinase
MARYADLTARGLNSLWYGGNRLYWILWPVAFVYGKLVALRRLAYRKTWLKSIDAGVPVVVVGNLTVGGTGKTPLVVWLARVLRQRGFRVGIICRGYRGEAADWPRAVGVASDVAAVGDEATLLASRTGGPVVAGPDRAAAAQALLGMQTVDVVLSDDGLQHYRLRRAFEIVVIDGTRGLGNGLCLPAGPLREPETRLREVDAVVVNDGDFARSGAMRASVRAVCAREITTGEERSLADFRGRSVHAVAAIGNPGRFFDLLIAHDLDVDPRPLADHAVLRVEDLRFDDDLPVMLTEKDAVKCRTLNIGNVWAVVTELEFASGDGERLVDRLVRALERQPENL